jgi:hypothetical protein
LPPVELTSKFSPKICVTHLNQRYQRRVDSIRTIEVECRDFSLDDIEKNVQISSVDKNIRLDINLKYLNPYASYQPFTASVSLEKLEGVQFELLKTNGWMPHPIVSNVYTKHFGLSENSLLNVVQEVYSNFDFMKDFLTGEKFTLSQKNGYNNFLLRPQALGNFYDLLCQDIINHRINSDFLLDRVSQDLLIEVDLSKIPSDLHDSFVLSQIQTEFEECNPNGLQRLMTPKDISDNFVLHAQGLGRLPKVEINLINQESLNKHYSQQGNFEDNFHLGLKQGSNTAYSPKNIDLALTSTLTQKQVSWTPLQSKGVKSKDTVSKASMTISQENDLELLNTTTVVQVNPLTEVEIDPSHIHVNPKKPD